MNRQPQARDLTNSMFSRRTALRGFGATGVAAALALPAAGFTTENTQSVESHPLLPSSHDGVTLSRQALGTGTVPDGWRMWYLQSADALRPARPGAVSQEEIDEILDAQSAMTPETTEAVKQWGTGLALAPWSALASELFAEFTMPPGLLQSQRMATLHTAIHDAAVAARDARWAHGRPGPAATDSRVVPAVGVHRDQPSFPSEHAAVAAAASTVLTYLFPDAEPDRFDALAAAAAESRIAAGASFRSDVDAGTALGRAVGDMAVARATEVSDLGNWDPSTMPTGPGYWQPTPPLMVETPFGPLAGLRTPWVLDRGDQFRSAPPPAHGSAAWRAELETVQEVADKRTFEQERGAVWWGTTSPIVLFEQWTLELIGRAGLQLAPAARILADLHVAIDDALIATWDGKYTYWTSRPITEDPELLTTIPTPPYPAYPGGYAAVMGAGSTVVGHYFPETSVDMEQRAWEASCSRLWAGIHYAIDNDAGLLLGRQVGRLVASLDRSTVAPDA
jgi:hypothetical protein